MGMEDGQENNDQNVRSNLRKQGNSSIHLIGTQLTVNSMGNEVIQFDTRTLADPSCPPLSFRGLKSTFYVKATSNGSNLIGSGSQDNHVYVWDRNIA